MGVVFLHIFLCRWLELASSSNPDPIVVQSFGRHESILSVLIWDKFLRFQLLLDESYEWKLTWPTKEWYPFHAPDMGRLSCLLPEELLREGSFLQLEWGSELWMVVIPVPLVVCIFNTATLTTDAN
jgi:hypothetical protein